MAAAVNVSRCLSRSAVVQAIVNFGPVSRARAARLTGLSKQTVSDIIANLEAGGWVRTVGQTDGHVGRRAVVYDISPAAATVATVDLGGAKVRAAICDLAGRVLAERVEPTHRSGGMQVIKQIARMLQDTAQGMSDPIGALHMAVVGVPGVPDPESGRIMMAPNITGIDRIDVAGALRALLGIEVLVENDVNLAALGEYWMGGRGGDHDLVFIAVGTGIGAGIVVDGHLVRGRFGGAGEIGFLPFGADPFEAESLSTGALERVAATEAIMSLHESLSGRRADVIKVFAAAKGGDAHAIHALDAVARQIARAVAAIVAVIDPSKIVIGGSIGARDMLRSRIEHHLSRCCPRKIGIEKTQLGNHAALAGGVYIAISHLHISLFAEGQKGVDIRFPPPDVETFKVGTA